MKTAAILLGMTLVASNAFAIAFITEDDVQKHLGADKVIEISKLNAQDKLVDSGSACDQALASRSSRAYVVKKAGKVSLFVTTEDLDGLQECTEL